MSRAFPDIPIRKFLLSDVMILILHSSYHLFLIHVILIIRVLLLYKYIRLTYNLEVFIDDKWYS